MLDLLGNVNVHSVSHERTLGGLLRESRPILIMGMESSRLRGGQDVVLRVGTRGPIAVLGAQRRRRRL